jgi:hypothetical protein
MVSNLRPIFNSFLLNLNVKKAPCRFSEIDRVDCLCCSAALLLKAHAVGTLIDGRVQFMRPDEDLVQRTEVLAAAMVLALVYRAFNAVVGVVRHNFVLLFG